ncbi:hypothetical protein MN608_07665 [Microdochium nivale]|nr:hypothetical protein MN608_07665 [Microdochium nivale]
MLLSRSSSRTFLFRVGESQRGVHTRLFLAAVVPGLDLGLPVCRHIPGTPHSSSANNHDSFVQQAESWSLSINKEEQTMLRASLICPNKSCPLVQVVSSPDSTVCLH